MEHPGAGGGEDEVEQADAPVDGLGDGGVETRFGAGAEEREEDAQAVELVGLGQGGEEEGERARREGVEGDVGPAADGVLGGVLPGLEAVAVGEVVGGLPEVEDCGGGVRGGETGGRGGGGGRGHTLVAVGDRGVGGGEQAHGEQHGEGGGRGEYGARRERARGLPSDGRSGRGTGGPGRLGLPRPQSRHLQV